ncbi:DUF4139 domain-containing protein [Ammoniphilus sp. CFH 90114]|uniref:DUF4139 domain-containing protein n=1 Tax=Ammoniphilus sp. CFH 90114 TaxID=2493665 RepID=UPI00100EC302|nr:DUF4139 domain-containing protein [Ammoniphilus sp. CFH 90114]RXT01953.1 DUF4139 domain-containing protein [Ammoniphilus sp. CFH 90114]
MKFESTKKDTKELSVTIYTDKFGVVKEKRRMQLPTNEEVSEIHYLDVAEKIETDSLIVEGLDIKELNFDYDLVSKEKMLEKYLDHNVFLEDRDGRSEYRLLSIQNGIVLENGNSKEIVINPEGQLILPKLPDGLMVRPALIWKVQPPKHSEVKVSYITQGMEWIANYVLYLKDDTSFNLSGWVNIENRSGATFEHAQIKLVAGDVKRVEKETMFRIDEYDRPDELILYNRSSSFEEKSFADYHLYTLEHETTLKNNQSKQINFITLHNIPYEKYYEINSRSETPKIMIEFENKKENGLGIPMPKGVMKVYREDAKDHHLEFIGEDAIDHTPKNERITLHIGDAFDIRGEYSLFDQHKTEDGAGTETHQYEIRNHKDEVIVVKFDHYIHHRYWSMIEHSHDFNRLTASIIQFKVRVQAHEVMKVKFQIQIDERIEVRVRKK